MFGKARHDFAIFVSGNRLSALVVMAVFTASLPVEAGMDWHSPHCVISLSGRRKDPFLRIPPYNTMTPG